MISNVKVRENYVTDGAQDTFQIPFQFIPGDLTTIKAVLFLDSDPTEGVDQTVGVDYDLDPAGLEPVNIIFGTAPAAGKLRVYRELPLTQILDYINTGRFQAEDHEKGMDRIVLMIQQLAQALQYTLKISASDEDLVDVVIPPYEEGKILGVIDDPDNPGNLILAWVLAGETGSGGAIPEGGENFDLLERDDSADELTKWTGPMVYQGFTERFSEIIDLSGIKAVLDYIMNMGYAPPTVSLSTSPNYATIREKGDEITSVDLTAAIVKTLNDIAEVRFYRGVTLIDTQVAGGGIPAGGNSVYTDANAFEDNRTYSVEVDDDSAEAKPSASSSRSFVFVYPYYYGVGAAGLGAAVDTLTKQLIQETTSTSRSFTVDGTEKMYFAYPASYGDLTHIYDINNFDTIADWTKTTTNITGLDGNPVSYNIYEFNNFAVAGTYQYTFQQ